MDRPKHRWFIALGILLACGVALLAGRQWVGTSNEQRSAPASVSATPVVEPRSEVRASTSVEAVPKDKAPAPAETSDGTFRGRVIDAVTRRPVREFEVRLIRVHGSREEPPITQTFKSGSGRFTWNELQAGSWTAAVSAHGYQRFELNEFSIVAGRKGSELVIPLLRGFTVRGRVFDVSTGTGVANASVRYVESALRQFDDGTGPSVRSKDDGTFALDGVPGGDIALSANAEGYAARDVSVFVNDEMRPVDVGLSSGGTISGRVINSAGAPIKGMVMLTGRVSAPYQTTEEGVFTIGQLPAGTYFLLARTPAGSARETIELAQDERRSDVTLTVLEGRTVRGTIRGLRPEQLKDAIVSVRSSSGAFNARPDDLGVYLLKGLSPGHALLTAVTRDRQLMRPIDVPADQDLVFDIIFPQGSRLSGRVTQGGQPAAGKALVLRSRDLKAVGYHAKTSQDGQYEIEGVAVGDYILRVEGDVSRRITLAGDTVVNVEIPLVQLGGSVFEDEGAVPVVGASIFVRSLDAATEKVTVSMQSDHFGQFKLTGIEPGEIQLTVYKPGYELYRETIAYSAPITGKTIRLRRGRGVEVRVQRSEKGEPEHGLLVMEVDEGFGAQFWIPLNSDGVGFIPSGLAGSSFAIPGFGSGVITIRDWDGSPLELNSEDVDSPR
jgi:hypothetical protein